MRESEHILLVTTSGKCVCFGMLNQLLAAECIHIFFIKDLPLYSLLQTLPIITEILLSSIYFHTHEGTLVHRYVDCS